MVVEPVSFGSCTSLQFVPLYPFPFLPLQALEKGSHGAMRPHYATWDGNCWFLIIAQQAPPSSHSATLVSNVKTVPRDSQVSIDDY